METLAKILVDFVKVPIANWYRALSNRMKTFVNDCIVVIVAVGLMVGATYFITNRVVSERLQDIEEQKTELHEYGTQKRIDAQTKIYNNLQCLMNETGSKRACVIELHNGVNNPSGLPYLYGEMTYEQTAEGVPFVADNFQKLSLSTYKMGMYMHNNYEYFGKIEDLKNIDKKFYSQVSNNGNSTYIGVIALHNQHKIEIGFLIITFDKPDINSDEQQKITFSMSKYATYIVSDLTMK